MNSIYCIWRYFLGILVNISDKVSCQCYFHFSIIYLIIYPPHLVDILLWTQAFIWCTFQIFWCYLNSEMNDLIIQWYTKSVKKVARLKNFSVWQPWLKINSSIVTGFRWYQAYLDGQNAVEDEPSFVLLSHFMKWGNVTKMKTISRSD